ncbi:MAG: isocitrate lyase/phosphoenolpyruvate mutase family protein [Vicinamibacteria bacterium]
MAREIREARSASEGDEPLRTAPSQAEKLRRLLDQPGTLSFPCCFDALSARLIERAGFALSFMSGFGVSAVRLGLPDTGLISSAEMLAHGEDICCTV